MLRQTTTAAQAFERFFSTPGGDGIFVAVGSPCDFGYGTNHHLHLERTNAVRDDRAGSPLLPPVLFSAIFRDEILAGHDGQGLRGVLEAHPEAVYCLEIDSVVALDDMDTPADYQRQERRFGDILKP
ncbi:MAG: hypothetical protein U1F83_07680 [Verrucomicrobiota bacterium]